MPLRRHSPLLGDFVRASRLPRARRRALHARRRGCSARYSHLSPDDDDGARDGDDGDDDDWRRQPECDRPSVETEQHFVASSSA